jgi:hypothetical protein
MQVHEMKRPRAVKEAGSRGQTSISNSQDQIEVEVVQATPNPVGDPAQIVLGCESSEFGDSESGGVIGRSSLSGGSGSAFRGGGGLVPARGGETLAGDGGKAMAGNGGGSKAGDVGSSKVGDGTGSAIIGNATVATLEPLPPLERGCR